MQLSYKQHYFQGHYRRLKRYIALSKLNETPTYTLGIRRGFPFIFSRVNAIYPSFLKVKVPICYWKAIDTIKMGRPTFLKTCANNRTWLCAII